MPRVGKKSFSYDEDGYMKAQAEADRTGQTMVTGYAMGGTAADFVSDKERRKLADDYIANSSAVNPDFAYDRASYELDQGEGKNRMKKVRKMSKGGDVFGQETVVSVPEGNGAGTMRGMGAATKGGKFSGTF